MPTETWVTMLLIGGFVWGGFLMVLLKAIRSEAGKAEPATDQGP